MHRFYSSSRNISKDKIIIDNIDQLHHIRNVLRLKVGAPLVIFDDKANVYMAKIEQILPSQIIAKINSVTRGGKTADRVVVTIACAIPKKSKMDDIVDKLTQLGVDRIIPMETARVVVKLDRQKKILKQKRWEAIALSACKQSQRSKLPIVEEVKHIDEVLSESGRYDLKLIPVLTGKRKTLREVFDSLKAKNVLVLIGPEGDFTPEEVSLARKFGCVLITLGELVLRVETAAVAVAGFIRLYEN